MRVHFERVLAETPKFQQFLWRVEPALFESAPTTHVVTSSVKWLWRKETACWWADEDGEPVDGLVLATAAPYKHAECLRAAGFES